jgi:hypothetical protein
MVNSPLSVGPGEAVQRRCRGRVLHVGPRSAHFIVVSLVKMVSGDLMQELESLTPRKKEDLRG